MAYTNRHIDIKFDGTQVNKHADRKKNDQGVIEPSEYDEQGNLIPIFYPELGDDIWVSVRNPMLMPQSYLVPKKKIAMDAEGKPADSHEAFDATLPLVASLIADWCMYDVFAKADEPLPVPDSVKVDGDGDGDEQFKAIVALMKKVPGPVTEAIQELIQAARNPR